MITVPLKYGQDDGGYVGRLREIPDCFSQGETLEELERNMAEVYKLMHDETNAPIPPDAMVKPLLLSA